MDGALMRTAVAAGLLILALMASGCATAHDGSGGFVWTHRGLPADMDEAAWEAAAEAEAARAVAQVWAVASGVDEVGARLVFTFWAEQGALTWGGYAASGRAGRVGRPVDAEVARGALRTVFAAYARRYTGEVELVLRREESGWAVAYEARRQTPRPPEARSLPVRAEGAPAPVVSSASQGLERLLRAGEVPGGGEARLEVEARLEDGRVDGWELRGFQVTRGGEGGAPRAPSQAVRAEAVQVLLPFTEGIGSRVVRLELRLVHRRGEASTSGWVEWAQVVRVPPSSVLAEDAAAEYRALHEDILRRWREGVAEGFTWLAQRGVEELALWYVGGVLAKGAGLLAVRGGGVVLRALQRGKEAATGWLRTMMARLSGGEKRAFERLWAKVQLEGESALAAGERQQLRALMARIEQLATTPLSNDEKSVLRKEAREFYKSMYPRMAAVMDSRPAEWPVHHRRPLQYAHLFPEENINAISNLAVVEASIHQRINVLWGRFRYARPHASAAEVLKAVDAIDGQFQPWYHQAGKMPALPRTPEDAEKLALDALRQLFPGLD